MVLRIESPAPPIKVESWLRGQPLNGFQPGKVYILEFWATWCAPCVATMPHLGELQEKYRDSGLDVVAIAASEQAPTTDEARTKLDAWLTQNVPKLNYRIAFDGAREMYAHWMEASSTSAIPATFVVDRDGRIAFIGNPAQLDDILPKVLKGIWRASDEAKAEDATRIAENVRVARERALTKPIYAKLHATMKTEDWTTALSVVEEGVAKMPDAINLRVIHVNLLLHKIRDFRAALPVLRQLVRDAIDRKSEHWMTMALSQLFQPTTDESYLPRVECLTIARELSENILALNPPEGDGDKFLSYGQVAQYFYNSGNTKRAIELIELALQSVDQSKSLPDQVKRGFVPALRKALADYRGSKTSYGNPRYVRQGKASQKAKAATRDQQV
ncbi:TlpA disulfide reductase family protein [Bradyrhizobium sp. Tv2a-2]|uniref:TlpA disulfide reductase family protein n=1 Tax=Bradyrhizobium sp. Tv2a-2 TaxID=113395 RepID=UPI0003FD07BC|nr:TlpA disulfide reductase family protein [Bradyrhizobium sp. Tv2a-2]